VFLGPKELPNIARMIGYGSGRAVGTVIQAKARFNEVAKDANIHELHQEVEQSLQQLGAIREEIRGGMNPFRPNYRPGPIARSAMDMAGGSVGVEQQSRQHQQGLDSSQSRGFVEASAPSLGAQTESASAFRYKPPMPETPATSGQRIQPLPLSAVTVGMAPARREELQGGADFMMDSIMERKVGFEAQKMFRQLEQQYASGGSPVTPDPPRPN